MKKYIKRLLKFVLTGEPTRNIKVVAGQLSYGKAMAGKNVLITGGNSGIGYYTALKCINEGAKVLIVGRDKERCSSAVQKLGANADYLICDFSNTENIPEMMQKAYQKYGKIDFLVCNVGTSYYEKTIFDVTDDLWDKYVTVNLKSAYFVSQFYLSRKEDEGAIVFTSSDWGFFGSGADKPYPITKGAINSMTMGLSCSFYARGIRVNAVAPGETATRLTGFDPAENMASDRKCGRKFLPEEMAEVIFFLLSDASKCISGQIIVCDGGDYLR